MAGLQKFLLLLEEETIFFSLDLHEYFVRVEAGELILKGFLN
jgi:hypothetical protein